MVVHSIAGWRVQVAECLRQEYLDLSKANLALLGHGIIDDQQRFLDVDEGVDEGHEQGGSGEEEGGRTFLELLAPMMVTPQRLPRVLRLSHVRSLSLSNNCIMAEGATILAKMLRTNRVLTSLLIDGNMIGNRGCVEISSSLQFENTTLTSLKLGGNAISRYGAVALARALGHNTVLKSLSLRHFGDLRSEFFYDVGVHRDKRTSLDLIVHAILTNPSLALTDLDLTSNHMDEYGGLILATLIESQAASCVKGGLEVLNLASNNLGARGSSAIFGALAANTRMRRLVMPNCGVGLCLATDGSRTVDMARMLISTSQMEISHAKPKDLDEMIREGALADVDSVTQYRPVTGSLSDCLAKNVTLQELRLNGNGVGQDVANMLFETVAPREGGLNLFLGKRISHPPMLGWRREAFLAFAMGTHARVGETSPILALTPDLVQHIAERHWCHRWTVPLAALRPRSRR